MDLPNLQRFISRYPPRYYLGPEFRTEDKEELKTLKEAEQPFPNPYSTRNSENSTTPELPITDAQDCRIELNRFLFKNGYGSHFACSEAKWGVCSGFRCECEFSLHVDDRFAIEIHAYELKTEWKGTSPNIRRYLGVFFFASDISDPTSDEKGAVAKKRKLREALVRPPQQMMKPPYQLVRLFSFAQNYGLEAFGGIPYVYPGKEGECIHGAIFIMTLLTSQWTIPIPPLETTFYFSRLIQEHVWMQNRFVDEVLEIVRRNGLDDLVDRIHDYFLKLYGVLENTQSERYINKKGRFDEFFNEGGLHCELRDEINSRIVNLQVQDRIEFLFWAIRATHGRLFNYAAEVKLEERRVRSELSVRERYDYFQSVRGISFYALLKILNSRETTSAAVFCERVEPRLINGNFRDGADLFVPSASNDGDPYLIEFRYNELKKFFHRILQCYLDERIPVCVPVSHNAFHGIELDKDEDGREKYDIDHAVTVIGYRSNPVLEEPAVNYITMDIYEEGMYKECSFDALFDASYRYDIKQRKNLTKGNIELPSLELMVCMPQNFAASYMDVYRRFSTTYPSNLDYLFLCQYKRVIHFFKTHVKYFTGEDERYLKRLSFPEFVWIAVKFSSEEFYRIRIVFPFANVSGADAEDDFFPAGENYRIHIIRSPETLINRRSKDREP